MKKFCLVISLSYLIVQCFAMEGKEEHIPNSPPQSPPLNSPIYDYSGYFNTRKDPEQSTLELMTSEQPKRHRQHKEKMLLTMEDHHNFLKRSLIKQAKKRVIIASPKITKTFFENHFIPWLSKIEHSHLKIVIYTTSKGEQVIEEALNHLTEIRKNRAPRDARRKVENNPLEDISREFHRTGKAMHMQLLVHCTHFCQSNVLIIDDRKFISSHCPWLSTEAGEGLSPPPRKQSLYFANILSKAIAKESSKVFLETLSKLIKEEETIKKDFSAQFKKLLAIAEEETISSSLPQQGEKD